MNKELKRLEKWYWRISVLVAIVVTGWNFSNPTELLQIGKLLLIMVGIAVAGMIALNVVDLMLGIIKAFVTNIRKKRRDKRLVKAFCTGTNEEEEN